MYVRIIIAIFYALTFISTANASVECLAGTAARNAFIADQSEPYFSLLQPREMAAKTGVPLIEGSLQTQRERVRMTYAKAVLDCTPEESAGLESYVSIINSSLRPVYPGLVALPWRFVKVKDGIEGGLPHTRADVIVISESLLRAITDTSSASQWQLGIMELLIHEQVHVIQRAEPKIFETFYTQQWGFIKVTSIRGADAWLASHQIVNPDGIDVQWVWPIPNSARVIWPRVILAGDSALPAMPADFRMLAIELTRTAAGYQVYTDKNAVPHYKNIRDESAYIKKFSGISSLYHPHEIMADYLSELAVWDSMVDKQQVPIKEQAVLEEKLKAIRSWVNKTFGDRI